MRISEALGTTPSKLKTLGVADSFLGMDSQLHIDPALLRSTRVPEFKGSALRFEKYFSQIMLALAAMTGRALEEQLISKLIFPEVSAAALGFSRESSHGRGVSKKLATQLFSTAQQLVKIGVKNPEIFELLVLFEEGFGADLTSDMTLWVILDDVSMSNARVCKRLSIPTQTLRVKTREVVVAHSVLTGKGILLLPKSLLSHLPVAQSSKDIDDVAYYNTKVREQLNNWLGKTWSNLAKRLTKGELRHLLFNNPDMLKQLIEKYRSHTAEPYDFDADPLGEVIWKEIGEEFAKTHPVKLSAVKSGEELQVVVTTIVTKFKRMVEQNGLWKPLYDDGGKHRPEKFAQLLFYSVADSYCDANNLDLSAEPNAGRGPVDFKISKGYHGRGLVEVKLSSSGKALDGLLRQLPTYALAEQASVTFYLLVVVGESRTRVDAIQEEHRKLVKKGAKVPALCIVEAYEAKHAPSASKLQYRLLDI